jgi:hypothetical protein
MTARTLTIRPTRVVFVAVLLGAMLAIGAADARANCFTNPPQVRIVPPQLQLQQKGPGAAAQAADGPKDAKDFVGMWLTEFRLTGGQLWDQGFELFHADGTEVNISNAVSPSLGNVCVGVWKGTGHRTIKLRHMAWNWNPDGTVAGTFLLLVTATLSKDGNVYEGSFLSDSYDTAGVVIPALHAEGTVRGTRIDVD